MDPFRYPDRPVMAHEDILTELVPGEWLAQFKPDGFRAVIEWDGTAVTLTSRHNKPIAATKRFLQDAAAALKAMGVPPGTIFDGEWMSRRASSHELLYVFDCLQLDGEWLGRRDTMGRFFKCQDFFGALTPFEAAGRPLQLVQFKRSYYWDLYNISKGFPDCEGIVLKHNTAPYIGSLKACVDNPLWLKIRWR